MGHNASFPQKLEISRLPSSRNTKITMVINNPQMKLILCSSRFTTLARSSRISSRLRITSATAPGIGEESTSARAKLNSTLEILSLFFSVTSHRTSNIPDVVSRGSVEITKCADGLGILRIRSQSSSNTEFDKPNAPKIRSGSSTTPSSVLSAGSYQSAPISWLRSLNGTISTVIGRSAKS